MVLIGGLLVEEIEEAIKTPPSFKVSVRVFEWFVEQQGLRAPFERRYSGNDASFGGRHAMRCY